MRNINEYNEIEFEESFTNSSIAEQVKKDFDLLLWEKHVQASTIWATPRQHLGTRTCSMTSFYYINKLIENRNVQVIHDIGCGWNLFKRYYPEIHGVSPDDQSNTSVYFGDEFDYFDKEFALYHANEFDTAMAICSLNYTPLSNIKDTVNAFISIIKPGGRGYISLQLHPMTDREDPDMLIELFDTATPTHNEIDDYVRDQLSNLSCNYLIFDLDTCENLDELDGDVRIVFERPLE